MKPKLPQLICSIILLTLTFSRQTSTDIFVSNTKASSIPIGSDQSKKPGVREKNLRLHREGDHPVRIIRISNLDDENFLQTLEVEIKNVSQKPLYYARLVLRFPDVIAPGNLGALTVNLTYGRPALIDLQNMATPEDHPLKPGESYILRISDDMRKNIEEFLKDQNYTNTSLEKVELRVLEASFGDGSGFRSGRPYPLKQTSNEKGPNRRPPISSHFFLCLSE